MAEALKRPIKISRRWRLFWMVAGTLACAAMVPMAAIGAVFSPLVFDHRGNLLNPLAWLGFLLMIGLWIICILGPFGAWVAWTRKQEPLAWAALAAPLAWFVALVAVLQFIPG
jgi:hypothetical protein